MPFLFTVKNLVAKTTDPASEISTKVKARAPRTARDGRDASTVLGAYRTARRRAGRRRGGGAERGAARRRHHPPEARLVKHL